MLKPLFILAIIVCHTSTAWADIKLRDPTQPLTYSGGKNSRPSMKLQSIIIGDGKKEAIISGKRVKERQTIFGVKILSIQPQMVTYSRLGKTHTLTLRKTNLGSILKKSTGNQ